MPVCCEHTQKKEGTKWTKELTAKGTAQAYGFLIV